MAKEMEIKGGEQVVFESGFKARIMGIDGTWWRECYIEVISQSGAKLELEGSAKVLQAKEFFLLLSSTGLAFRRCELVWIDGVQVGVRFVAKGANKKDAANKQP